MFHRDLLPEPIPLRRAEFGVVRLRDGTRFRKIFHGPACFGRLENAIVPDASLAALPLPQASPQSAGVRKKQCCQLLPHHRPKSGVSARVREQLLRVGVGAEMDQACVTLGTAPRRLRRQLATKSTSSRCPLDEVRKTLATEMLPERMAWTRWPSGSATRSPEASSTPSSAGAM